MDMCKGLKELLEDEREEGIEQGISFGEKQKLKEQVKKKLAKGCLLSDIADMLEEDESVIKEIIKQL